MENETTRAAVAEITCKKSPPAVMAGRRFWRNPALASECFDFEHLAVTVISAGRAGDVRRHFAAALGAVLEDRCAPTLRATAHFLTAFGLAALWNGHGLEVV
jgi:hypothetical protein